MPETRTERRFGVTAQMSQVARRNLLNVRDSEIWPDLLDVFEMTCIEMETVLINTDADKEAEVLANHRMAKAAWQMFAHFQVIVDEQVAAYRASIARPTAVPPLTREEIERENILDPTRPMPEEYAPTSGD